MAKKTSKKSRKSVRANKANKGNKVKKSVKKNQPKLSAKSAEKDDKKTMPEKKNVPIEKNVSVGEASLSMLLEAHWDVDKRLEAAQNTVRQLSSAKKQISDQIGKKKAENRQFLRDKNKGK